MPDDPAAIRELAVEQWTTTVAFRETIEAMHADGLRLFVDVGARGNLAGFVEDILRGKPAFAIAANLPRRSGLTQLNHLVASIFAQGVRLKADYLYARRRPRAIDWNAPEPPARDDGRAGDRLSRDAVLRRSARPPSIGRATRVRAASTSAEPDGATNGHQSIAGSTHEHPSRNGNSRHDHAPAKPAAMLAPSEPPLRIASRAVSRTDPHAPSAEPTRKTSPNRALEPLSAADDAMLSFQETMQAFLQTQQEIMTAYLEGSTADHPADACQVPLGSRHGVDSDPGLRFTHSHETPERRMTSGDLAYFAAVTRRARRVPPARSRALVRRGSPAGPRLRDRDLDHPGSPRRPDRPAPHAGRPQGLGPRPVLERASRSSVRGDGRDDRAGRRPGGDTRPGAYGLDAGASAQMGALRG